MGFSCHPQLENDSITLGDFPLSRLLLINDSQYPWFVLVPKRENIQEIYQLTPNEQQQFFTESTELSHELMRVFNGDKLNVAALGNMVPQLHVHHIIRFKNDNAWPAPVWGKSPMLPYTPESLKQRIEQIQQCQLTDFNYMIEA